MANHVPFSEDEAREHLLGHRVWPVDDEHAAAVGARGWWLHLLEKVTDAAGEHDWHDESYPGDRYTEFTEIAVDQMVAQARKTRAVLRICDASDLSKVVGPDDEEVENRLLSPLFESDGTAHQHRHDGESWGEYEERMARLRRQHREACKELLTLNGITELYLTAAAVPVARAWCERAADAWAEANPEPDEDEED